MSVIETQTNSTAVQTQSFPCAIKDAVVNNDLMFYVEVYDNSEPFGSDIYFSSFDFNECAGYVLSNGFTRVDVEVEPRVELTPKAYAELSTGEYDPFAEE